MTGRQCYCCSAPESSREHVPPRCIFPEATDAADGVGYRSHAITVPSCDLHNAAKSGDDEYLLQVLAISILNNAVGGRQATTKVQRAFQRFPGKAKIVLGDNQTILVKDEATGKVERTIAVTVAPERLKNVFEHIVRAIYYHHFNKQLVGAVITFPEFLMKMGVPDALEQNQMFEQLRNAAAVVFETADRHGAHPDVFFYQVFEDPSNKKHVLMRLTFYEGSRVSAFIILD